MHLGFLKPEDLNEELISKTYAELAIGASKGYGKNWLKTDTKNTSTVKALQENLYSFSGAKTYQQLEEMNSFLVDESGKIRTYNEFKRKVDVVHKKYNRNYLEAEFTTARRSGQAVRQWQGYEDDADLFPNLEYMTILDDKVREDHSKLHGIIKPVNDPFWDTHYPPNGFRCRCYVKSTTSAVTNRKALAEPDKGFGQNVGKTNQVFASEHPYFSVPKDAQKNMDTSVKEFKKAQKKKDGKG